jgi:hypothetical protein
VSTKVIKTYLFFQAIPLLALLVSFDYFINAQTAFLSAFFILLGSMYSYSRLIERRVESFDLQHPDERDVIDQAEDPYDLYSEDETVVDEDLDLKSVIKEEKAKLKKASGKNMIKASPATFSLYRLLPYLFLVLGFIALNNNKILDLLPYMAGLTIGIVGGLSVGKLLFSR